MTKGEMTMVMIKSMRTSRANMLTGGWQLIPMDHHFLSVYSPLLMLLLREHVEDINLRVTRQKGPGYS